MSKNEEYRQKLQSLTNWDEYLLINSGLPGPRGNLELAQVVADLGTRELFERYRSYHADTAPSGSPYEFLAFCGVLGLGRLLADGEVEALTILQEWAGDPRWRLREAVAMALQRYGEADMPSLLREMRSWGSGTLLERRAAAAALCEPRLLAREEDSSAVLLVLDQITSSVLEQPDRRSEDFKVLRQGLGYSWSVATAANPLTGKGLMEKWLANSDPDIRWIMRENLKKNRLARMDAEWVRTWLKKPLPKNDNKRAI